MSTSSLVFISITLLVLILTVESAYNAYLYDNGNGDDEHCCLARINQGLCLATPITRSLIQVDKQCHRHDRLKGHRYGESKRKDHYLNKITRRLNVQSSEEIGDKILLELKTPLETDMIQNDLVCLTSTNKDINLEKCHLELNDDELDDGIDDDDDHDHMAHRRHKQRGHRRHHFDRKKRVAVKTAGEENEVVNDDDDDTVIEDDKAEQEARRIELHQPVRIREDHGLFIRQTYHFNLTRSRLTDRHQHRCLSWYRKQTRKIRRNPSKHKKTCVRLNDHNEKCINQLVYNTKTDKHSEQTAPSLAVDSKLYCEDQAGSNKFIGLSRHREICFHPDNQIDIEQKFTDIAGLSNMHKNHDILQFIANHKKYTAEFEHDCHGKATLVEVDAREKELQSKKSVQKKLKRE